MQKKLMIVVGVIILLAILAGGAMVLQSKKSTTLKTQTQNNQTSPQSENKNEAASISGTIKDILMGGKTQACSIDYPDNMGTGTIYIADKKFSGNFTIKDAQGKSMTGYMVSDGTYMYSWSGDVKMGVKMNLAQIEKQTAATQNGQKNNLDVNQKVDFKCSPWTTDNSKFTVPADIKFTDLSTMMQQLQPTGQAQTQKTGSPCDQISDPTAKAACSKALQQSGSGY